MSIPASERLRHALAALGAVGLIYAAIVGVLHLLVRRAEATQSVYPYKHEDWLRWLVPALWEPTGKPLLLIVGPSSARENLRVEAFGRAFPEYRSLQGSLSLGALSDVMAALEYVERAHGTKALPSLLILGVSPRFLADIPEERPFAFGLAQYSPDYYMDPSARDVPTLVAKSAFDGTVDHARFLVGKQQGRYQAAVAALFAGDDGFERQPYTPSPVVELIDRTGLARLMSLQKPLDLGLRNFARDWISPYRYEGSTGWPEHWVTAWLDESTSWWQDVYRWDPSSDAAARARIAAFLAFANRHGMELYVINLPERSLSRRRYDPRFARGFASLVATAFHGAPVLDLRCLLADDEFFDVEHALSRGAKRVTERMVGFMRDVRAERARAASGVASKARSTTSIAAAWAAGCGES